MGNTCKTIDFSSERNQIETITFEKKVMTLNLLTIDSTQ